MKLTIEMPWEKDLSVNLMRFGKGGGYRRKPHVQDWMRGLSCELSLASGLLFEGTGWWDIPVRLTIDFRFPDKRRRDDHNYYKVICDAVAAGLGIDDKDIRISTGSIAIDRNNPGFTISIEDSGIGRD